MAAVERAEIVVIERYLPAKMGEAEIVAAIQAAIAQIGAKGPADMGKLMGARVIAEFENHRFRALGAGPGEVIAADSTSVNLHKALHAALALQAELALRRGDLPQAEQQARQIAQLAPTRAIGYSLQADVLMAYCQSVAAERASSTGGTSPWAAWIWSASTSEARSRVLMVIASHGLRPARSSSIRVSKTWANRTRASRPKAPAPPLTEWTARKTAFSSWRMLPGQS